MSRLVDFIDKDVEKLATSSLLAPMDGGSVMITGATGLIGTYLVAALRCRMRLTGRPLAIHAVGRSAPPSPLAPLFDDASVRFHACDLADAASCRTLPSADRIIHAAGYGQPGKFLENPVATLLLNTATTAALLEKTSADGGFLFISSSEVNSGAARSPHREEDIGTTDPGHPRASYIEGKRCGEAMCHAFHARDGKNVKIARLALAYGPGTRADDQRVLNSLIRRALLEGKITLLDRGAARRTYCYITDAVEMMFSILLQGQSTVYNVGGQSKVTILELAHLIADKIGVPVNIPEREDGLVGAPSDVALSIERYCREFAKTDFIGIEQGLDRTIEWQRYLYAPAQEPALVQRKVGA